MYNDVISLQFDGGVASRLNIASLLIVLCVCIRTYQYFKGVAKKGVQEVQLHPRVKSRKFSGEGASFRRVQFVRLV